jgi:Uma2 family endonuclease
VEYTEAMADAAEKRMTVAEFLDWDDGTDMRYELIDGRVRAITPPDAAHSIILANVGAAVAAGLKEPAYAGLSAGVIWPDRDDLYLQADLLVSLTSLEAGARTIPKPILIVEVVSRATIQHDRGRKAYDYSQIDSIQEIVLVSSEQHHVVIWRRRGAKWEVENLIGDSTLGLEAVGVAIPFAAIYADSGV